MRITHRLPVEPFAEWLTSKTEKITMDYFSSIVREDSTWLGKVKDYKYKTVDIDRVDSILCNEGTTHLRDIYPELYEE
jgi:hypothetical protein